MSAMTDRIYQVKFEDSKGITRSPKSEKDRPDNGQTKRTYRQTTLHRKLKIEQHELT